MGNPKHAEAVKAHRDNAANLAQHAANPADIKSIMDLGNNAIAEGHDLVQKAIASGTNPLDALNDAAKKAAAGLDPKAFAAGVQTFGKFHGAAEALKIAGK